MDPTFEDRVAPAPRASVPVQCETKADDAILSYVGLFRSSPSDRIAMIKGGLEAAFANVTIMYISRSKSEALRAVDISHATMNRWVKAHAKLPPAESERVLGVGRLVGQVQAMVEESGDPRGFDAGAWLTRWLGEPLPALGGVCPRDLLDTIEGQRMVSEMLARMRSGAYA